MSLVLYFFCNGFEHSYARRPAKGEQIMKEYNAGKFVSEPKLIC